MERAKPCICPICQKSVQPGLYALRLECKHWNHIKCLTKYPENFQKCPSCLGLIDANVQRYVDTEPDCYKSRDYVNMPLSDSYFNSIAATLSVGKEPFKWLSERAPIDWIRDDKDYGLQRLIASGVKFEHFLMAGYTWDELKTFKDFGDPKRIDRGRQALFALKCNAEHLRDYSHLLGNMVQDLQISGRHMCELFGLGFEPGTCKPLAVYNGKNNVPWKATHLIKLGFKMCDLQGAGLQYLEQYASLEPSDADEVSLEVKDEDISSLVSVDELMEAAHATEVAAAAASAALAKKMPVEGNAKPAPRIYIPPVVVKQSGEKRLHGLRTIKKN
jgi:hypothetical protein